MQLFHSREVEHLKDYRTQDKLAPTNGGSYSALTQAQSEELISHLAANLYATVHYICGYVQETYATTYSVAGMTKWLHRHKFSYKKPHPVPSKADPLNKLNS